MGVFEKTKSEAWKNKEDIWPVLRKCAKIDFPSWTRKLRWSNKNWFDENDCNENSEFSWTTVMLTEPMRHQNLYISYGDTFMKQSKLCTMYEFKCSKDIRHQKPGLGPCLSYKIMRISMLRYWLWWYPAKGYLCIYVWHWSFPYEIDTWTWKWSLFGITLEFPIWNWHLDMSRYNIIFACIH